MFAMKHRKLEELVTRVTPGHDLLHFTHCSSRGDLNAGEGGSQLLMRLGELALLGGELGGQLSVLLLALGQLLLQLLGLGLICTWQLQQQHEEWREGEKQRHEDECTSKRVARTRAKEAQRRIEMH